MLDRLQEPIRALLKVPPAPDPPRGDPRSVRVFRAAPGYLRYRLLAWLWKQLSALAGLVFGFALIRIALDRVGTLPPIIRRLPFGLIELLEYPAIAIFLIQLPITLLLVVLDYRYRWYVVTDRSLRIREGLWKVQERTMTFSNVQNVSIRQGPVQRLFGIADLQVQTAGGGGKASETEEEDSSEHLHIGYFRGIENPGEIRDAIRARLRRLRASGLGDPDEPAPAEPPIDPDRLAVEAAGEVLRETRALASEIRSL